MPSDSPSPEVKRIQELLAQMTGRDLRKEPTSSTAQSPFTAAVQGDCAVETPSIKERGVSTASQKPGFSEATAFERIVKWVNVRERSTREVLERLRQEGYAPETAKAAVDRALRCGLVDDARFMQTYILSKIHAGWGQHKIEQELRKHAVNPYDLIGYPATYFSSEDELERAVAILRKKRVPSKDPIAKLARHLAGKGFAIDLSIQAARIRMAESVPECVQNMD